MLKYLWPNLTIINYVWIFFFNFNIEKNFIYKTLNYKYFYYTYKLILYI